MATMAATARVSSTCPAADVVAHQRTAASSSCGVVQVRGGRRNVRNLFAGQAVKSAVAGIREQRKWSATFVTRAESKNHGEDPDWSDDDYIVLGLAHCFRKDDNGKLVDAFVVEPVTAGTLECMENGGVTCYKCVTATNLGVALKEDVSLLPGEMQSGTICDEFTFRAMCASRTWKRDHPQQNLLHLVPKGKVKSEYNFCLQDKRVLDVEVVVNDSDNIKQDMSIDVYGRQKEDEISTEISELYSV